MRARRGFYNIIFGILSQVITIILGMVLPKLLIVNFSSEINGLLSSINQIFVYLGLFEAGVGATTLQALYNPITKEDHQGINSILAATHKYYLKTGILYAIAMIGFAVIYPFIIKTDISWWYISIIILLVGTGNVINFLFQAKFKLLLQAEGKGYVVTNILTFTNVGINVGKIIFILLGFNIVVVQSLHLTFNIIQMIILEVYQKKHYSWIDLKVEKNDKAIAQKNSALIHQLAALIFSNTDIIILTAFCGLKVVSVYTVYNMLFNVVLTGISNVNSGVVFAMGQIYCEDRKKYERMHDVFDMCYTGIGCVLFMTLYIMILPFMEIYAGGITDINYLDVKLPILFALMQCLSVARGAAGNLISIAGHFKKTQGRAIMEMLINLMVSLILVSHFGIYGVLIGTIVALLYRTNDMILYSNHKILNRSAKKSYRNFIINLCMCIVIMVLSKNFVIHAQGYGELILQAIIVGGIILVLFVIANVLCNLSLVKTLGDMVIPIWKQTVKKLKR